MTPSERIAGFLLLAGIDRPVEKIVQTAKGKVTQIIHLEDRERIAGFRAAAEKAQALMREADAARDLTIATAKHAIGKAIAVGEFLIQMSELLSGDFDEWIENYFSEEFSRRTAYRYMKATRYKDALGDDCPDFASLKELYVAAGLLPAPDSDGGGTNNRPSPPLYRVKVQLPPQDAEDLDPVVRKALMADLKPAVDYYERLAAVEEAA